MSSSTNPFDNLPEARREFIPSKRIKVAEDIISVDSLNNGECKQVDDELKSKTKLFEVDVCSTLQTLSIHLNNKKKQSKALQLLLTFSEAELRDNCHSSNFFSTTNKFIQDENIVADQVHSLPEPLQKTLEALVDLYLSRGSLFSTEERFQIETWHLLYSLKGALCCDDSFRFSKACRTVEARFNNEEMFPPPPPPDSLDETHPQTFEPPTTLRRSRIAATLACLRVALPLYTRAQWAKQPLDQLFAVAASRRLEVDGDQREELDELTTKITLAKRKHDSGKPVQTVRTYNSTAHPLKTKHVGILR